MHRQIPLDALGPSEPPARLAGMGGATGEIDGAGHRHAGTQPGGEAYTSQPRQRRDDNPPVIQPMVSHEPLGGSRRENTAEQETVANGREATNLPTTTET